MNPSRMPIPWRRQLIDAFTDNLPMKASAVLLAIAMWMLVAAREPMEQVVGVRFAPQLDSNLVLRDPPPVVRAVVLGSANEILKLANTPLAIRRPVTGDSPDTLVVSLRATDVAVPDGVEVIVRDVQPHSVTLRFESTTSRFVAVASALLVRGPLTSPVPITITPDSVQVSGPRRLIARLRHVSTVVDSIPFDTLPHLVDLDTAGLGVVVRPSQVRVSFPGYRRP
jgi:YbbR domain-containing protein